MTGASTSTPRISDYALIGDTRTAALSAMDGSIDWMCIPAFDSHVLFGRLVGGPSSGSFSVSVAAGRVARRNYVGDSAVLETHFEASNGRGRLIDGMPVDVSGRLLPATVLVRRVVCDSGRLTIRIRFDPKLGLPGRQPRSARRRNALVCHWGSLAIALQSFPHVDIAPGGEVEVEVVEGSDLVLMMTIADRSPVVLVTEDQARALIDEAIDWWEGWTRDIDYEGPFAAAVIRSLITLQLLTFSPSGAPVAAPTTSLPELVGGTRNWDYRFSWPRDASIGLLAFLSVGKRDLAHSFMHWLQQASRLTRPRIKVLYSLYGKPPPTEHEVSGVTGFLGSLPVRIGNEARTQHQLDVYGWVVDAAWLLTDAGHHLHPETWRLVAGMADFVTRHWREPDAGIWEVRGDPRQHVHSKLMAWLCLDRALRVAEQRKIDNKRVRRWTKERDAIRTDVERHGFNNDVGAYVRTYDSDQVDAALLVLPTLGFEDADARVKGTVDAIRRDLETGRGLVYRYRPGDDGLPGTEGTFLPCSFWLVQALALTGRRDEATEIFESLLAHSNDVGLFSEEIDPATGELLGNFPQAFTHATLVQAALSLDEKSA